MNFNFKTIGILNDREINSFKVSKPINYEKEIVKSIYDSSEDFHMLMRNLKEDCFNFCFSEDGNFMTTGKAIWKVTDSLLFNEKSKVMDILQNKKGNSVFSKDSTKVFTSVRENEEKCFILVNDLSTKKTSKIFHPNFVKKITTCSTNRNLFLFSDNTCNIYLHDLRCYHSEKVIENSSKNIEFLINLEYKPMSDHFLLVNFSEKRGFDLFDLRNRKTVLHYDFLLGIDNECFCKYNKQGDQIFVVRKNLNPVLFYSEDPNPSVEFDETNYFIYTWGGRRCCFAGPNDEYVVSSSDDSNVYFWEIPKKNSVDRNEEKDFKIVNSAKFFLKNSHETLSIDYNHQKSVLACFGVNEYIRFWSPMPFFSKSDSEREIKEDWVTTYRYFLNINFSRVDKINFLIRVIFSYCNLNFDFPNNDYNNIDNCDVDKIKKIVQEDLSINYIKSFIKHHHIHGQVKRMKFVEKLDEIFKREIDFKERFFDRSYFSLLIELSKIYKAKNIINKSKIYLNKLLTKMELSEKAIDDLENDNLNKSKEKTILKETKKSLKLMLLDLEIIFEKNRYIYENLLFWLEKLINLFHVSNEDMSLKENVKKIFIDLKKDFQKMNLE